MHSVHSGWLQGVALTGIQLAATTYTTVEHWTDLLCVVRV